MESPEAFNRRLIRYYSGYALGFIVFVAVLAYAERQGMSTRWIDYCFMAAPIAFYSAMSALPGWIASWGKRGLVRVEDINGDGIRQLAELSLNTDVMVLATPEIAGLPYVVSGLVAAGGLSAALSTADGLLLTIANALSHDIY